MIGSMNTSDSTTNTHDYTHLQHPLLIIVRGMYGSGKSYLAAQLHKAFGEDAVVALDPDTIDRDSQEYRNHSAALTAEGVDAAIHPYRFSLGKAFQGISDHKVIIWNQPFTNLDMFKRMIGRLEERAAQEHTTLPMLVVEVSIDPAVAKARVAERQAAGGNSISDEVFAQRLSEYASFASEGYTIVSVRGEDDVAASVATVLEAARALSIDPASASS
jgi:predicted ABC-type ATPase